MGRRVVDLTARVFDGMRSYPGVPAPSIAPFLTHEQSRARYQGMSEFCFTRVSIVVGAGTYLDAPRHRYPGAPDLAALALEITVDLPGVVVDARGLRRIGADKLGSAPLRGRAVLVWTGMDAFWETDRYWRESPFLADETAERLAAEGAALVGVDFLNVDALTDLARPAHTRLLGAGIPIVENLRNLGALPSEGFRFHAAPPAFVGAASFHVRAYALL